MVDVGRFTRSLKKKGVNLLGSLPKKKMVRFTQIYFCFDSPLKLKGCVIMYMFLPSCAFPTAYLD